MTDELKDQIRALKDEVDELKKQLTENKKGDERRHEEIKKLQKQQHADDMKWKKINAIGMFSTPLTLIVTLFTWWLKNRGNDKKSNEDLSNKIDELFKELKSKQAS